LGLAGHLLAFASHNWCSARALPRVREKRPGRAAARIDAFRGTGLQRCVFCRRAK